MEKVYVGILAFIGFILMWVGIKIKLHNKLSEKADKLFGAAEVTDKDILEKKENNAIQRKQIVEGIKKDTLMKKEMGLFTEEEADRLLKESEEWLKD